MGGLAKRVLNESTKEPQIFIRRPSPPQAAFSFDTDYSEIFNPKNAVGIVRRRRKPGPKQELQQVSFVMRNEDPPLGSLILKFYTFFLAKCSKSMRWINM